jgi:hypothetical protein
MRDPERLDNTYETIKELHKEHCPDWRTGQLILNFLGWYGQKYGDPWFIEETQLLQRIKEYFTETFH